MELEQQEFAALVGGLAKCTTQNDEIIRRLNMQNGRVDRLEIMQWRLCLILAATVGSVELISNLFL